MKSRVDNAKCECTYNYVGGVFVGAPKLFVVLMNDADDTDALWPGGCRCSVE